MPNDTLEHCRGHVDTYVVHNLHYSNRHLRIIYLYNIYAWNIEKLVMNL